jgi:hypothetical protein
MSETTTTARRSIGRRMAGGIAATGAAVAITLAGAGTASAQSYVSQPLAPGSSVCSAQQYASYQVRADGFATAQGAKFKLLRNGVVVVNTPNRATNWATELRSAYGTFPGPGYYQVCAQNTGTTNTTATVQLRTDYEF